MSDEHEKHGVGVGARPSREPCNSRTPQHVEREGGEDIAQTVATYVVWGREKIGCAKVKNSILPSYKNEERVIPNIGNQEFRWNLLKSSEQIWLDLVEHCDNSSTVMPQRNNRMDNPYTVPLPEG